MKTLKIRINDYVRDYLKENEMTQTELAKRLEMSPSTLSTFVNKNHTRLDVNTAEKICNVLEIDPATLFEWENV